MHYAHRISQARIHQIVGWFVLLPALILGGVLFVVGNNQDLFAKKYEISTVFSEGFGLRVGYPVTLLGLQVGRINSIEFTDQNNARFKLKLLKKYQDKIRANSVARVEKSGGLIGDPQIEITPGSKSEPIVADGGQIVTLREKNAQLESKLQELIQFGSENDAIAEKLHRSTLALFAAARAENDVVVASLFVNAAQFGPAEDLERFGAVLVPDGTANLPADGLRIVVSIRIAVVLPAPFGPSTPRIRPSSTVNESRSTAMTGP